MGKNYLSRGLKDFENRGFMFIYFVNGLINCLSGGFRAWSKEQGLGPCREGVRGFESHLPHFGQTSRSAIPETISVDVHN